jgi:hypothetical protein
VAKSSYADAPGIAIRDLRRMKRFGVTSIEATIRNLTALNKGVAPPGLSILRVELVQRDDGVKRPRLS